MTENQFPKLRPVDIHPIVQQGQQYLLLRDPLQLGEITVSIPRPLAPILGLCDGTRDSRALSATLGVRFGIRVTSDVLDHLFDALDEALLLENERFVRARERAVRQYRQAPFRPASLAGRTYPAELDDLRRLFQGYLDEAGDIPPVERVQGLVSPHIDYERGGSVYARTWSAAREAVREADLVLMLGTDHFGGEHLLALTYQDYETPFGVLPTSQSVVETLVEALGEKALDGELYHRHEHSIELGAVWLHHMRDGEPCEFVPILCGSFYPFVQEGEGDPRDDPTIDTLVRVFRQAARGRRVLVVAAADLAHVGPAFGGRPVDGVGRAQLKAADDVLMTHMCAGDVDGFFEAIKRVKNRYNVCGLPPIYLAL
ncbi:MAG TPA: AmmeMemoRadiSam system protein B, partial [Chloroflexi bacterium]|nr:AmmeMemoRadiSam system protein B [Chloroflexota bacterium]